jgi:hypothetical protein
VPNVTTALARPFTPSPAPHAKQVLKREMDMFTADNEGDDALLHFWHLYFPFDEIDSPEANLWTQAAKQFRIFFSTTGHPLIETCDLQVDSEIVLDYKRMVTLLTPLLLGLPNVLKNNAVTTLACLSLAICSLREFDHGCATTTTTTTAKNKINVRLNNYYPSVALGQLNASHIGQLISIHGTATRVTGVTPLIKNMHFVCQQCGDRIYTCVSDGIYKPPTKCDSLECKSKKFKIEKRSVVCVDFQMVRLSIVKCCCCCCPLNTNL